MKFNSSEFSFHQRRGLVRGRPTTPPSLHFGGVPLPIRQSRTGMIGFAILLHINKIGACAPKLATCNLKKRDGQDRPLRCSFHQRRKQVRGRPTTPPSLHYGAVSLPILLRKTGMIGFATLLHINKIGACAPKLATCNLQLATVTGMISFAITNNFFGRYIYGF